MRTTLSVLLLLLILSIISGCAGSGRSNYKPQNLSTENAAILIDDLAATIAANTPAKSTVFEIESDSLSSAIGEALKKKGYAVVLSSPHNQGETSTAKRLNYTVDWLTQDSLYATVIVDNDRYSRAYSMASGKLTPKGGPMVGVTSHE